MGDPLDNTVLMGPLHRRDQVDEFVRGISKAKADGGRVVVGGSVLEGRVSWAAGDVGQWACTDCAWAARGAISFSRRSLRCPITSRLCCNMSCSFPFFTLCRKFFFRCRAFSVFHHSDVTYLCGDLCVRAGTIPWTMPLP